MKKIMFLFLIAMSFTTYGQTSKSVTIWTKPMTKEVMIAHFLPDSIITINFLGQDNTYNLLTYDAYFPLFSGSPHEFYIFLTALEKFSNENKPDGETSIDLEINGQTFSMVKSFGVKLRIWEKGGIAYRDLLPTVLPKFKEKFIQWAIENNVLYN